jgi:hypothetical protein
MNNKKTMLLGLAGALAIGLLGGTASAQSWGWSTGPQPYDRYDNPNLVTGDWFFDNYGTENIRPGYYREIYGRVLAVKKVWVRGHQEPHLAALITTYSHQKITVDLGDEFSARRLALRPYGDRLWVTGEFVNLNGRPLILARTARTEFRRIAVDWRHRANRGISRGGYYYYGRDVNRNYNRQYNGEYRNYNQPY